MKSPEVIQKEITTMERKLEYSVGALTDAVAGGRYVEAASLVQSVLELRTRISTLKWVIGEETPDGKT